MIPTRNDRRAAVAASGTIRDRLCKEAEGGRECSGSADSAEWGWGARSIEWRFEQFFLLGTVAENEQDPGAAERRELRLGIDIRLEGIVELEFVNHDPSSRNSGKMSIFDRLAGLAIIKLEHTSQDSGKAAECHSVLNEDQVDL